MHGLAGSFYPKEMHGTLVRANALYIISVLFSKYFFFFYAEMLGNYNRSSFTEYQVSEMRKEFKVNQYIQGIDRRKLADRIGLADHQVRTVSTIPYHDLSLSARSYVIGFRISFGRGSKFVVIVGTWHDD